MPRLTHGYKRYLPSFNRRREQRSPLYETKRHLCTLHLAACPLHTQEKKGTVLSNMIGGSFGQCVKSRSLEHHKVQSRILTINVPVVGAGRNDFEAANIHYKAIVRVGP
jgi:hypothetical protein